jgi:hypothetical protein
MKRLALSLAALAAVVFSPVTAFAVTQTSAHTVSEVTVCLQDLTSSYSLTYYIARHDGFNYLVGYSELDQTVSTSITPSGEHIKSDYGHSLYNLLLSAYLSGRNAVLRYDNMTSATYCGITVTRRLDFAGDGAILQ